MEFTGTAVEQFIRFLLVLSRLGGIFMMTPLVGGPAVPGRVRLLLAAALSFAICPMVHAAAVGVPGDPSRLLVGIAGELAVGVICGFVVNIVFVAAQMAGSFLSHHMGTAFADVVNPLHEAAAPVFGQFYYLFAVVVFVGINGHHILIAGLVKTFDRIPLMGATFDGGMVAKVGGLMGDMFILMIKLAAPTFAALFLVTVVLGILARTVPQLHVFVIGFPVKVLIALAVTSLALAGTASLLSESFSWIMREVEGVMRFMVPG